MESSQSPVFDIVFLFLIFTVTVMKHKERQMITDTMSPLIKLLSIKLVKICIIYWMAQLILYIMSLNAPVFLCFN